MKILIATATFNEADNIKILIKKIHLINKNFHILIVDDNSPDNTSKIIKKIKNKKIILKIRKKKEGLDSAHKLIYDYALKKKYDYLITMDADLSHDPKLIPKFLKYIKKYDCVIGSRYIKGGQNKLEGIRYFMSKFGNIVIKKVLNSSLHEFTTSYRCFNLKNLKNFNFNLINVRGYSFFMAVINLIYSSGYSIKEIPITFYQRNQGESKIPKSEIFRTILNLLIIKLKKI